MIGETCFTQLPIFLKLCLATQNDILIVNLTFKLPENYGPSLDLVLICSYLLTEELGSQLI